MIQHVCMFKTLVGCWCAGLNCRSNADSSIFSNAALRSSRYWGNQDVDSKRLPLKSWPGRLHIHLLCRSLQWCVALPLSFLRSSEVEACRNVLTRALVLHSPMIVTKNPVALALVFGDGRYQHHPQHSIFSMGTNRCTCKRERDGRCWDSFCHSCNSVRLLVLVQPSHARKRKIQIPSATRMQGAG